MARRPALLVDLDGTLTDNFVGIARSIRHALLALGAPEPADAALQPCIGPPLRASFARLLATDDPVLIERALTHYRERYADLGWQENVVYDGVGRPSPGSRPAAKRCICAPPSRHPTPRRSSPASACVRSSRAFTAPTSPARSMTRQRSSLISSRAKASIPGHAR